MVTSRSGFAVSKFDSLDAFIRLGETSMSWGDLDTAAIFDSTEVAHRTMSTFGYKRGDYKVERIVISLPDRG